MQPSVVQGRAETTEVQERSRETWGPGGVGGGLRPRQKLRKWGNM